MIAEFRLWSQNTSVQHLALQLTNCVMLEKILKQTVALFPHLQNEKSSKIELVGLIDKRSSNSSSLVAKLCLTLATPQTVARQAPLSMGFSRQEYWSGLPLPSPGDLPNPVLLPRSPALQADSLLTEL